ncbi:MAG: hypothetical protein NT004_05300 [Bacteroidetes bacterium]|nr:hypothetical protein [Bacteroidota bacterium]
MRRKQIFKKWVKRREDLLKSMSNGIGDKLKRVEKYLKNVKRCEDV